jgi:hypothetical protein
MLTWVKLKLKVNINTCYKRITYIFEVWATLYMYRYQRHLWKKVEITIKNSVNTKYHTFSYNRITKYFKCAIIWHQWNERGSVANENWDRLPPWDMHQCRENTLIYMYLLHNVDDKTCFKPIYLDWIKLTHRIQHLYLLAM